MDNFFLGIYKPVALIPAWQKEGNCTSRKKTCYNSTLDLKEHDAKYNLMVKKNKTKKKSKQLQAVKVVSAGLN